MNKFLSDITNKNSELQDQSKSYEYFYRVVLNDNTARGLLNPKDVNKIIHKLNFTTKKIFIYGAKNGHIDTLKYLLSLEKDPVKRSEMIHAEFDDAFSNAASNGRTDALKYLVVSDPFYKWLNIGNKTILDYYKNIDIKSLCKISTLFKYLFSTNSKKEKNNENSVSFIDLPTDIIEKILQNLVRVDNELSDSIRIESIVKAFTYDSSNYFDGLKGFTDRYESAL